MSTASVCVTGVVLALLWPSPRASAQTMSESQRASAVSRSREIAGCLDRNHHEMQRIMRLMVAAERQRQTAGDAAARRDADAAIEALLVRVGNVQRGARECLGQRVPQPGATQVIERPPSPDPSADAVAGSGGSLQSVESNVALADHIHVVRGQQVDGQGRLDPRAVRQAVRRAASRIARCYDTYLDRGSMEAHHLDLVFSFRGSGAVRQVDVENSDFHDERIERCIRTAGRSIRASSAPRGGEAQYSYRLRFGRAR